MGGPCSTWAVSQCTCASNCWTSFSPTVRERAAALAAHFMWAATGRRYGPCEVTVLPCNPAPADPLYQTYGLFSPNTGWGGAGGPYLDAGTWRNSLCAASTCSCVAECEVPLPGPVASVVEVSLSGEPVDPTVYEIHDGGWLVRTDGVCWPTCNQPGLEIPGFSVTYLRGAAIPWAVQYGLEGLACQLAKACTGAADCTLPPRMRSLTRQGVAIEVATEQASSQGGKLRTGVSWIDQIIEAANPHGLTQRPTVHSLDLPEPRVLTWGGGS